jgi:hypothetical protein
MLAALNGNAKAMNVLLDRGADRKLVDQEGKNALDFLKRKMAESGPQPGLSALQAVADRMRSGN